MKKREEIQSVPGQTVVINTQEAKKNGLGTAGFVFALIGLFLGWIPIVGWILSGLGLLFSFIGIFKSPRGLAIAGFVISVINGILLVTVFGALAALIGIGAAAL